IDWIIAQTHRCACCSSSAGHDSDAGIRAEWLPLFDAYQVDLVVSGHGPGYQRSPRPVTTTDSGVFDTSQGTVHLVLGGGIAVFDLDPGTEAGGQTSITVTYYHEYTEFETFTLVRPVASKA
ncbi:MAG: hypothetical protein J2P26_05105, partial [Nocardiopsaceae bacterium]|nr:hypothetical protein [Nocardiopsaceae bacterium]